MPQRLILALLLLAAGCGGEGGDAKSKSTGTKPRPKPRAPSFKIISHVLDAGRSLQVTCLVVGKGLKKPVLRDETDRTYEGSETDPADLFFAEIERVAVAKAFEFQAPTSVRSLDLKIPGGESHVVYRKPGIAHFKRIPAAVRLAGQRLDVSGRPVGDGGLELTVTAVPDHPNAEAFNPATFYLLTDRGKMISPRVRGEKPYVLRYDGIPPTVRKARIQTGFRGPRPDYLLVAMPERTAAKPTPVAPAPADATPKAADLKARFSAEAARDPIAALRSLAGKPAADARPLARNAIAHAINVDLAAGKKAIEAGDGAVAERHLSRAALLAAPYHAPLSDMLVKMIHLAKEPRKGRLTCSACSGSGAADCKSCEKGLVPGDCSHCASRGKADCFLCGATGKLDHYGFRGKLVLTVPRTIKVVMRSGRGTLYAQTINWNMSPCAGQGSFNLHTQNRLHATGRGKQSQVRQTCANFWKEMKMFVFNGRAEIRIAGKQGLVVPFAPVAARRFLADYGRCKAGKVPCDLCEGKMQTRCILCGGRGKSPAPCTTCAGSGHQACSSCHGYGDASWLKRILPEAPAIASALKAQAAEIDLWLQARARLETRRSEVARALTEVRKKLDSRAKLTEYLVEVPCPRCKGKRCAECWATGRREYGAGTAEYARYDMARRLERRLEVLKTARADDPEILVIPVLKPNAPVVMVQPRKMRTVEIPGTVKEMIRKADGLHKTGLSHLLTSKESKDEKIWIDEGYKALDDLRNAQTLYASAQETLDAKGQESPMELLKKFRINMQALVMARKQVP